MTSNLKLADLSLIFLILSPFPLPVRSHQPPITRRVTSHQSHPLTSQHTPVNHSQLTINHSSLTTRNPPLTTPIRNSPYAHSTLTRSQYTHSHTLASCKHTHTHHSPLTSALATYHTPLTTHNHHVHHLPLFTHHS